MTTPKKSIRGRGSQPPAPPRTGNRVFGDDAPMPWREAAKEIGMPERTFWRLLERREIAKIMLGGRAKVRPSALRKYTDKQEVSEL